MKNVILCLVLLVFTVTGCDDAAVEDELELSIDSLGAPIQVDTVCENGGCDADEYVAFTIEFDEDAILPTETEVELLQYRIDYTVPGLPSPIPFYAGKIELLVYPATPSFGAVMTAGQKQREFIVANTLGDVHLVGRAMLTLAGYDQYDEQVFLEAGFDIAFGDFQDNTVEE